MRLTKNSIYFRLLFFYLNLLQVLGMNKEILEYSQPSDCKNNEYFDTNSFVCVNCDASKNLQPSIDRLKCVCNKFSKRSDFKSGHPVCISCGSNAIVTADGKDCLRCKNSWCKCPIDHIQIDRNLNGTLLNAIHCLPCPKDTYPSLDRSKCIPCNNFASILHSSCTCPSTSHVRVQNYCLQKDDLADWLDVRSTYLVKFEGQTIDSYYLRKELQIAMYFCKRKDRVACEHLSNMCAMTLYANGAACMLFMQKHMAPTWLFYNKDETVAALNSKQISQRYSLMKENNNSTLNFTIATFSLEGELRAINKPDLPCNFLKYVRFGVNFRKKCKLTIKDLLSSKVEFMTPYLTFMENEKTVMHAVPVFIKNINEETGEVSHWQLVRKFFVVDNISGFRTLPNSRNNEFKKDNNLLVLRYMKTLNILVNVQNDDIKGKIYPPLITIEYAELTINEINKDVEVILDHTITFTLKDNNIDYNLEISLGILSGLALIFSGIKTWSYCKRNYTCMPSITVLFWFLIYAMGAVGNVIILTSISLCIYLFVFYKGQTVPYILLPDNNNEKNIRIYTITAFSFKLVEMIGFIYQYWNVNIFFVDWEQPNIAWKQFKYDSPHTSLRKLYCNRFSEGDHKSAQTPSEIIAAKRKKTPYKLKRNSGSNNDPKSSATENNEAGLSSISSISEVPSQQTDELNQICNLPVSIWRTYFVANQWLKLQTKRKINVTLHFIVILLISQIMQPHSWALAVPELIPESFEGNQSFTLYYAVCAIIYISIYFIQWLVSVAFYERYIKNRMQEFVDLCSIANISVFILPFKYYGFYIHGRSVHGFADTDLSTLIKNLKNEENNLCAHRGLMPGTIEQTFVLSLTETFRNIFNQFSQPKDNRTNKFLKNNQSAGTNLNHVSESHMKLKQFLSEFVDHCYKEEDYIIKELHFFEKLCNISFYNAKEKSVFYRDNSHSFDEVLFYGNEWLLTTFEIAVFAFIIVLYEDYIIASIITVLISMSLTVMIKCNCKKNLSIKALLDKRFLM